MGHHLEQAVSLFYMSPIMMLESVKLYSFPTAKIMEFGDTTKQFNNYYENNFYC